MRENVMCSLFRSTFFVAFILFTSAVALNAQCKPSIKVDGVQTIADPNDQFGLQLPMWLKTGQTLAVGSSVSAISAIEFTETGNALEYSQVVTVTSATPVAVPEGKVWKVEAIVKTNNASSYRSVTFSNPGTYTWKVPACAEEICVEAWAGGGGGGSTYTNATVATRRPGGGGGGGAFGSQCFPIVPGTELTVNVGAGGIGGAVADPGTVGQTGGASGVVGLITVLGGAGGGYSTTVSPGGAGGTSTATSNAQGAAGENGSSVSSGLSGRGGAGGNGAAGGAPTSSGAAGNPGATPGGGGSGGSPNQGSGSAATSYSRAGGNGGDGRVIITW